MGATEGTEHAGAGHLRRLLGGTSNVVWLVIALVAGWLLWPSSLGGCTTLTIVSGHSMEPTYYTGDLVVARCGAVDVGDVIVYQPTDVGGARVIHRIIGGSEADGWTMQGDNNDFTDPWFPRGDEVLGSAALHLPQVGKFASLLLSPLLWISLLVIALAVVIWPGKPAEDDEGDVDEGGADGGDADEGDADGGAEIPADPGDGERDDVTGHDGTEVLDGAGESPALR